MNFESDPHLAPLQFKGEIMDFDLGLEVDHRKRRRNRTTQSCLNCHTSKRKCDRKRPCQRCIQLGLTGLCVYEVDDPALRDDPNIDETTRLRNRIAELESLVRELRGKPHPKWAEPNYCDGDVNEKWHSRSTKRLQSQFQKPRREGLLDGSGSNVLQASAVKTEQATDLPRQQLYSLSTSTDSSLSHTVAVASHSYYRSTHQHDSQHGMCSAAEDASAFYSSSSSASPVGYPGQLHPHSAVGGHYPQQPYTRTSALEAAQMHCSCLTNPAAAHPLIALTNQLRTASHMLRQLPEHSSQHECLVLTRILELDDVMHGGGTEYSATSAYEGLPTPAESEIMSPTSSSSHSSLGNPMDEWTAMGTASNYNAYFPVSAGEHTTYHKTYHVA
ncbi:uncharacterized protein LAESUDRAFT_756818 [Laetiporus sulphureus 93-53]|uniref:Zn(2)-C6 fungal-type domain-containing protein n=1 Tax=Laetiporus sulphureus 93-53 TaxID=1314785 RepID=A0A165FM25_9APHY|nr:uncharacterized protein LAESUDRAFT_756818 [Laetiporus sulphureus 93-53]KZT09176.1 hypothetical protein LAESUDRAFT_756818 [Laetiporus sulphureus 93-53]